MFNSKLARRWLLHALAFAAIGLGWAASAHAQSCSAPGLGVNVTFGTVAASTSLAVGSTIPGAEQPFRLSGQCTGPNSANKKIVLCPGLYGPLSGTNGVWSSGIAGVGILVRSSQGTPVPLSTSCADGSPSGYTDANGSFSFSGTFELVKTGTITAGSVTGNTFAPVLVPSTGTYVKVNNNSAGFNFGTNSSVRLVTCSVTAATANQTIALTAISPSMLNSAGATAATTPFSIDLTCQSGVKVAVTFSSASGNSGIPSVIASNGTAKGVGVQLLNASRTPISLDTALQLSSGTTGNMSFPFYGQYYRLGGPEVAAGTVNASAIFTMSYQ